MRFLWIVSILCVSVILGISCKKQTIEQEPDSLGVPRKVQFLLYTDKDFSSNNGNILFTVSIKNSANKVLWDSVLPQMKIKDIPSLENKLVIEKSVPGNAASFLKVGFYYSIENIGDSWHEDSFNAGETLKIVDFNFQ